MSSKSDEIVINSEMDISNYSTIVSGESRVSCWGGGGEGAKPIGAQTSDTCTFWQNISK